MELCEFRLKLRLNWSLSLWFELTIIQNWFRWWLGRSQATIHYLNQCRPGSLTHICSTRMRWVNLFSEKILCGNFIFYIVYANAGIYFCCWLRFLHIPSMSLFPECSQKVFHSLLVRVEIWECLLLVYNLTSTLTIRMLYSVEFGNIIFYRALFLPCIMYHSFYFERNLHIDNMKTFTCYSYQTICDMHDYHPPT